MNDTYTTIPSDEIINATIEALKKNNIDVIIATSHEDAKQKVLDRIPHGAEVMNNLSVTLDTLGIAKEIMESGKYNSVKKQLAQMNRETQNLEMKKLGSAPDYALGSVHAITQDGHVLIASGSGSQLPGYAYGSPHVIWVAGAHKIVKNIDEGMKRIYEHSWPLENERMQKTVGSGSNVRKILIVNSEFKPGRITLILLKEAIGF